MPVPRRSTSVSLTPPSHGTLAKYGLTLDGWLAMCHRQRYTCPVCGQPFGDRPLVIDHEHVRGWRARKRKGGRKVRVMGPAERRKFVRGVLHSYCNRLVRRWLTLEFLRRTTVYLETYHRQKELARDTVSTTRRAV